MKKNRWLGSVFQLFISLTMIFMLSAVVYAETDVPSLSWEQSNNNFTVTFSGVNFTDVVDFTWNGKIVTDAINKNAK